MMLLSMLKRKALKFMNNKLIIFFLIIISSNLYAQNFLENLTSFSQTDSSVVFCSDTSCIEITFYKEDIIRFDLMPFSNSKPDPSFVIINGSINSSFSFAENENTVELISSKLKIVVNKAPLRFSIYDNSNSLLIKEHESGGLFYENDNNLPEKIRGINLQVSSEEHFYGTGQRGPSLNLRGKRFNNYNTQTYGYANAPNEMNINVPFILSSKKWGIYFDNYGYAQYDLASSNSEILSFKTFRNEFSFYFIYSETFPKILENYTWLTGRQPLPPRWALGYIQSKFGYESESEARSIVQTLRSKKIPADALVLDLFWFEHMGDISWNLSRFPNPFQMVDDFLETGIKTIVITEPYVIERSINFSDGFGAGFFAKKENGSPYLLPSWWSCGCNAALIDFTNPDAANWWWNKHPEFLGSNVAGLWTDLGEPERHPDDMQHFLGDARTIHNIYNFLWAKRIFDGYNELRPNSRLFNLIRSGFAGIQRFAALPWSGDVSASFTGLNNQLGFLLNNGLSGLAYHHSDIGGFVGHHLPEVYTRWMQFGAFTGIMRAHGTGFPQEPWAYGAEAERISVDYIKLRYELLPYNYSMAYQNYQTGIPIARPLFFDVQSFSDLSKEYKTYFWGR